MERPSSLIAPVSYQGNKSRIASQIVHIIHTSKYWRDDIHIYDICCGGGSITLEFINQGSVSRNITMIDCGLWGLFWKEITQHSFLLSQLQKYIQQLPQDPHDHKSYIESLLVESPKTNTAYKFILFQACNFAGKAVRLENNMWKNISIKPYWSPKKSSVRQYPSYTFTVHPTTLLSRLQHIIDAKLSMNVIWDNAQHIIPEHNSIVYIDPDYSNSYGYGSYHLNLHDFITQTKAPCFISENHALTDSPFFINAHQLVYTSQRTTINAKRSSTNRQEWLSIHHQK